MYFFARVGPLRSGRVGPNTWSERTKTTVTPTPETVVGMNVILIGCLSENNVGWEGTRPFFVRKALFPLAPKPLVLRRARRHWYARPGRRAAPAALSDGHTHTHSLVHIHTHTSQPTHAHTSTAGRRVQSVSEWGACRVGHAGSCGVCVRVWRCVGAQGRSCVCVCVYLTERVLGK